MSVLVVDDDPGVLRAHSQIFERAGFEVVAVTNAFDALEAIKTTQFKAIVCDHKMPNLAGGTFFEQLEEFFTNLASRVVFVTGWAEDGEVEPVLRRLGQPVLLKPVEVDELVREVKRVYSRPG